MTKVMRSVQAIVCDGCGYDLGSRHTTLELNYAVSDKHRGKLVFHFHETGKEHDCLRYWVMGPGIMKRTLKDIELLSDEGRDLILKTVGGFNGKGK